MTTIGAAFIVPTPNLAESGPKSAPWLVFGLALMLVMFIAPRHRRLAARRIAAPCVARRHPHHHFHHFLTSFLTSHDQ